MALKREQAWRAEFKNALASALVDLEFRNVDEDLPILWQQELLINAQDFQAVKSSLVLYRKENTKLFYKRMEDTICIIEFTTRSSGRDSIQFDFFVRLNHLPSAKLLSSFQKTIYNPLVGALWMGCGLMYLFPSDYRLPPSIANSVNEYHINLYKMSPSDWTGYGRDVIKYFVDGIKQFALPWLNSVCRPESLLLLLDQSFYDLAFQNPLLPEEIKRGMDTERSYGVKSIPSKGQIVVCLAAGYFDEAESSLIQLMTAFEIFKAEKRKTLQPMMTHNMPQDFSLDDYIDHMWKQAYVTDYFVQQVRLYISERR
jgi:hypothetical protein